MTIGQMIYNHRKERNLTLEDVGTYCGVPRSTVSRWERGEIQKIKCDKAEKLCEILEIDPIVLARPAEALTVDEYYMLTIYRKADDRARKDAIKILLAYPENEKKEEST